MQPLRSKVQLLHRLFGAGLLLQAEGLLWTEFRSAIC